MLNVAGFLYLGSRIIAAAGNLVAIIIFTRWAGPAEYGHYVLIYAWAAIVYGFAAQWVRVAYFGVYNPQRFGEYIGSLALLLAGSMLVFAIVMAALGFVGIFEPDFLFAVFALLCGITVYDAAFEVARTLLHAGNAALSMLLRTLLTLTFGSASLWLGGGARGLALAVGAAHAIAAIPSIATFVGIRPTPRSRAASLHILSYGWPLLLSFGVNALASSIDRLLLAHYAGAAALGPYGVSADMLRQSFTIFGEAIILSFITLAKQRVYEGNPDAAKAILQKAFNACLAATSLGAAFFIVFGDFLLRMILQPEFITPIHGLIPIFAVAFAFMIMRNYYFAQVIFFTHASYLDLLIAISFLVTSTTLSVLLVPSHGLQGAALSLMVANILSCIAFMMLGRRWYKLPIDVAGLTVIPALAIVFVFGARGLAEFMPSVAAPLILDAIVFALFGGFAIHRFGLLSLVPHGVVGREMPAR